MASPFTVFRKNQRVLLAIVAISAMVAFVFVFVQMRRLAGRDTLSTVAAVIGTAGALALSGQFAIDVVAGLLSTDHLGMSLLIADIRSTPGVTVAVYDVGPYLFYIGQLALVVRLAVMRRIKAALDPAGVLNPGKVL